MARARVELTEAMTYAVHGRTFKRGESQIITDPDLIRYFQSDSEFAVTILEGIPEKVKVVPPEVVTKPATVESPPLPPMVSSSPAKAEPKPKPEGEAVEKTHHRENADSEEAETPKVNTGKGGKKRRLGI